MITTWQVNCEFCPFVQSGLDDRKTAIMLGHGHIHVEHKDDEEWSFRVRGFSRKSNQPKERTK